MLYKDFLCTLRKMLQEQLSVQDIASLREIPRNNGVMLDGICIEKAGGRIAPTLYLNSYYEQYEEGLSLPEICEEILSIYYENLSIPELTLQELAAFHLLKDKVAWKLVAAEANALLLKDIPHLLFLDLAIIFYLLLEETAAGQMISLIHQEHCNAWNISLDTLAEAALSNTPKLFPANIKNMTDVMKEIAREQLGSDYQGEWMDELFKLPGHQTPIYVLTNQTGLNGACCMLYPNLLKDFADKAGKDLILLPSSIHEILLIPEDTLILPEELREMVIQINSSDVPPEDRLSNQIYRYQRCTDSIQIIPPAALSSSQNTNSNLIN